MFNTRFVIIILPGNSSLNILLRQNNSKNDNLRSRTSFSNEIPSEMTFPTNSTIGWPNIGSRHVQCDSHGNHIEYKKYSGRTPSPPPPTTGEWRLEGRIRIKWCFCFAVCDFRFSTAMIPTHPPVPRLGPHNQGPSIHISYPIPPAAAVRIHIGD